MFSFKQTMNDRNIMDDIASLLSHHSVYFNQFVQTHSTILRGDGPLAFDCRYIIAIMAAGRHQCCSLMNLLRKEFLDLGGDPSWLNGLTAIPKKLRKLYEINKILAHRPWLINKSYIENLTKGSNSWSLSELMHAIIILVHVHSLSTFIFSAGINGKENSEVHLCNETPKIETPKKPIILGNTYPGSRNVNSSDNNKDIAPLSPPSIVGQQEVRVETLMERMKDLSRRSESPEIAQEELSKRFQTIEIQSAELTTAPLRCNPTLDKDIGLFIEDSDFIYQDFIYQNRRGKLKDAPTFRIQDYSWENQGFSLVNKMYSDVGNLLDDKLKTAYNLTYNTMGRHSGVDTSRFRIAAWNYIQCLYGIRRDDYDYNEVNQLLERSLKTFIKNAVCYPERVTRKDYVRVMPEFHESEKIHVSLLLFEARMQAELLYALRAIMHYIT